MGSDIPSLPYHRDYPLNISIIHLPTTSKDVYYTFQIGQEEFESRCLSQPGRRWVSTIYCILPCCLTGDRKEDRIGKPTEGVKSAKVL